jgi:hypothetical protein
MTVCRGVQTQNRASFADALFRYAPTGVCFLPRRYAIHSGAAVWFGPGRVPGPAVLLQQLGHFLLHAVGLCQSRDAGLAQDFVL